ncbi:uncharacterized protein LOC131174124 [Hevea brasiliensis]|uniref:uncharacterized protein LOC131174124 n=1 Tax=Hevea brasiliensis TaxID=3981 RepID=UPI0025EE9549|nr:uncharacterized protein LOC131174124 [Hevea brasiliensis]
MISEPYCHGYGYIFEHCPTRPPRPKGGHSKFKNVSKPGSSSVTAVAATEGSTAITMSDLEALFKQVQDPQTGQILREGRRVGRLFELASLHLSQIFVSAATIPNSSIQQWHLRLGHASAGKIQPLISHGLLGSTKFESFNCLNCQLAK